MYVVLRTITQIGGYLRSAAATSAIKIYDMLIARAAPYIRLVAVTGRTTIRGKLRLHSRWLCSTLQPKPTNKADCTLSVFSGTTELYKRHF